MNMKKILKNEKGVTLVELLAVIIIISLIVGLVSSIQIFGVQQYNNQMKKDNQLSDITFALKVITKDIRKSKNANWKSSNEIVLDGIVYKFDDSNKTITKDGVVFVKNIKKFKITGNSGKWKITISSLVDKTVETEIVIRKGG